MAPARWRTFAQIGNKRVDGAEVRRHLAGHLAEGLRAGTVEQAEELTHGVEASLRGWLTE
jgi:hypothetical protein